MIKWGFSVVFFLYIVYFLFLTTQKIENLETVQEMKSIIIAVSGWVVFIINKVSDNKKE
jgi:1-acyl-sn-glycerol-3-phosphate acyltransferase